MRPLASILLGGVSARLRHSGFKASRGLVISDIDPVHAAVKGQLLENCSHHFNWIRLWR
jgi:hypothetical protein